MTAKGPRSVYLSALRWGGVGGLCLGLGCGGRGTLQAVKHLLAEEQPRRHLSAMLAVGCSKGWPKETNRE